MCVEASGQSDSLDKMTKFSRSAFPSSQRRGGCGIHQKSRSHRRAADGVVAHATRFQKTHSETRLVSDHPSLRRRGMRLPRIGGKHYVGHLTGALCVTDRQSRHVENYSFGRIGKIKAAAGP